MPEIARFLGIIIFILYDDHSPPHFHARYAEYEVSIEIDTGVITGTFPRRALSLLLEWYLLNKDELYGDWELA
jgi:hypothetical protein